MSINEPLTTENKSGIRVVYLPEMAIDAASANGLKERMAPILEADSRVVLEFSRVRFVDSAGLGCILGFLRTLQQKGGELKVCGLSKSVRSLFEMVRFHRVVEIFPDVDESVRAFEKA